MMVFVRRPARSRRLENPLRTFNLVSGTTFPDKLENGKGSQM
jgi:hypothetical protein